MIDWISTRYENGEYGQLRLVSSDWVCGDEMRRGERRGESSRVC